VAPTRPRPPRPARRAAAARPSSSWAAWPRWAAASPSRREEAGEAAARAEAGRRPRRPPCPPPPRSSQTFSGSVADQEQRGFLVTATRAGTLDAMVTWQDRSISLGIGCQLEAPPYTGCGTSNRTSDTTAALSSSVTQTTYLSSFRTTAAARGPKPSR
jgi:hypothetical protein